MIFLPTNSNDGTSDVLVPLFNAVGVSVFRWNVDLWDKYEITVSPGHFKFEDPRGRTCDIHSHDVFLLWRKPFTDLILPTDGLGLEDIKFVKSELREFMRTISAVFASNGRTILVEPYADLRLPKLLQVERAQQYFNVPQFEFSFKNSTLKPPTVVKPLGTSLVGEKIFFTRKIDQAKLLRPHPWYLQSAIVGGADVTCVIIGEKLHLFFSQYTRSEDGIDWRTEINTPLQSKWERASSIPDELNSSISKLMKEFGLLYGRIDFIFKDGIYWFLECNPNGQFGWLDDQDFTLHREFASLALGECGLQKSAKEVLSCKFSL